MLITGQSIIDRDLLEGATDEHIRSSSYYLSIHCIIPAGEEAKGFDHEKPKTSHTLEPGGLAWVISEEIFNIKDFKVTALVTLRSGFTKKGMLALDVGLVDANYHGPIGSVVINCSKNDIRLSKGDEFFRVVFFEHEEVEGKFRYPAIKYSHTQYINQQLNSLISEFPTSFMQTDQIESRLNSSVKEAVVKELREGLFNSLILGVIKKRPLVTTVVLVATILGLGFGANWIDRHFFPTVLNAERQQAIVCEMIENEVLQPGSVVEGVCD